MKKIYLIPSINVVNIQTAQLMTTSPGYSDTTTDATSGNLSRRGRRRRLRNDWDDEDEDYEEEF